MNPRLWIPILALTACTAFAIGWSVEYRRTKTTSAGIGGQPVGNTQSMQSTFHCDTNSPDDQWYTVQSLFYQPFKTLYIAEWQFCPGDIEGHRVRITDDNSRKVFYEYEDDEIVRVEQVELTDSQVPQLLVVTGSSGTNDAVDWSVLSEVNGELREWTWPDYDAPAEKLLRADEDFCCKEWNFHLRGHDIVLARGIYHKRFDGNCCPTRGGVLVLLKPIHERFKLVSVQRISSPEYDRWRSKPFCFQCTLLGP